MKFDKLFEKLKIKRIEFGLEIGEINLKKNNNYKYLKKTKME